MMQQFLTLGWQHGFESLAFTFTWVSLSLPLQGPQLPPFHNERVHDA